MSCLFEKAIELINTGEPVGVENPDENSYMLILWGVKLEKTPDCPYNVCLDNGKLLNLSDGTLVVTGYGHGR